MGSIPSIVTFSLCDKRLKRFLILSGACQCGEERCPTDQYALLVKSVHFVRYKEVPVGAKMALQGSACWGYVGVTRKCLLGATLAT